MVFFDRRFHVLIFVQPENVHTHVVTVFEFVIFFEGCWHTVMCVAHSWPAPTLVETDLQPFLKGHQNAPLILPKATPVLGDALPKQPAPKHLRFCCATFAPLFD